MKAILKFNLPEEREEYGYAFNGLKYCLVLENLNNYLRLKILHDNSLSEEQISIYKETRNQLWGFLNDESLTL